MLLNILYVQSTCQIYSALCSYYPGTYKYSKYKTMTLITDIFDISKNKNLLKEINIFPNTCFFNIYFGNVYLNNLYKEECY